MQNASLFVDGVWSDGHGQALAVEDPVREEIFTEVFEASPSDVDDAVAAARRALDRWSRRSPQDRASLIEALADDLAAHAADLASIVAREMGAPPAVARGLHVDLAIEAARAAAAELRSFEFETQIGHSLVIREAVGVVGAITPWNLPLYQVVVKVVPALAAGCTVVLKPSELAPVSSLALAHAAQRAGFPDGVLNVVLGGRDVAEALIEHRAVSMISFTGSTATGRSVAAAAAATVKRTALELGGKSASLVMPDVTGALLDSALKVTVGNCFLNSGQVCTAQSRLLVPHALVPEIGPKLAGLAQRYAQPGRLGPLISGDHRTRVRESMATAARAGAEPVAGGPEAPVPERGHFVAPTIYSNVHPDSELAQEEVFGPVLAVLPYETVDDAVATANGTVYGLGGAVWSADRDAALAVARLIRAGQVDLNGAAFNVRAPFGGYAQSGLGRELGAFGIEGCLEIKSVQR